MIFGTFNISPSRAFISEPSADKILGINVAVTQFLSSLITYGSFDEYHLFVPPNFLSEIEHEKKDLLYITGNAEKIKIFQGYNYEHILQRDETGWWLVDYIPALIKKTGTDRVETKFQDSGH